MPLQRVAGRVVWRGRNPASFTGVVPGPEAAKRAVVAWRAFCVEVGRVLECGRTKRAHEGAVEVGFVGHLGLWC